MTQSNRDQNSLVAISEQALAKATRLGMYGAPEQVAERLRALAQSAVPAERDGFNFQNDKWQFKIQDNRLPNLNRLTSESDLEYPEETYRERRAKLAWGKAGSEALPTKPDPRAQVPTQGGEIINLIQLTPDGAVRHDACPDRERRHDTSSDERGRR